MQNITIYPKQNSKNQGATLNLAIPVASSLEKDNLHIVTWSYYQEGDLIHHQIILTAPGEMPLTTFFTIIRLALDWNDAEYKCTGLLPLEDNTWEFSFTFKS